MKKLILLLLFVPAANLYASHNRGGEIIYKWVSGLKYEATLTTYTDFSTSEAQGADRPQVSVNWGDGITVTVNRSSYIDMPGQLRKNIYTAQHTYTSTGFFTIGFKDPNRTANIINMANSFLSPFYIESVLKVGPVLTNKSHTCLTALSQMAYVGSKFVFDPQFSDVEGDSLVSMLVPPKEGATAQAVSWNVPTNCSINQNTGVITWNSPSAPGCYIVDILTLEFRNGVQIGSVQRELYIVVTIGTSAGNVFAEQAAKIYPNPCREYFNLSLSGLSTREPVVIWVTDLSGKVVMKEERLPVANTLEAVMETTQLKPGVYMLATQQGADTRHGKFVVR